MPSTRVTIFEECHNVDIRNDDKGNDIIYVRLQSLYNNDVTLEVDARVFNVLLRAMNKHQVHK